MNVQAKKLNPRLSCLCLAIAIALASPAMALAQEQPETPAATAEQEQAADADADEQDEGELFSLEDSDDPARLKELTQIRSSVEFGLFHVSDGSFRFGRYTGLNEEGLGLLLNVDISKRGAYDSDDAGYWSFRGDNLGIDSRAAAFEIGVQGKYKLELDYSQIPNFRSESGQTIFDGAGSSELTLPSDWVASGNTAGMTRLLPSLQPFDLQTQRRRAGIAVSGVLNRHWDFSVSFRRETKEGTRSIGAVFGNSGGNPRAVVVPEPVDWTTEQFEAVLRYTARKFQVDATYYVSVYSDANSALTWENPYTTIGGWAAPAGFPNGVGQLSLPPDNKFHQLSLNFGYNFSDATRFTASVARGRMTQDDEFLPYTDIPALAASITQPLPRDSLDGRIDTTLVDLRLSSRPTTNLSWTASYRYDDRDNETPRDEYVYIGGDSQFQNTSPTSSFRRFNEPYGYREEQLKLDASYRMFGHTELNLGLQRSKIDRTYLEREQADEDSYWIGLRSNFSDRFNGRLRYVHARRDGSTYVGNEPFLSGYSPGYTNTVVAGWENHPDLRRYFEADRDRDQFTAMLDWSASEALTLSASLDYAFDDYTSSEVGLVDTKVASATVEAVYAPSPLWSAHAFQTYEQLNANQNGHSFAGGANQIPQSSDPRREWFVHHRDRVDTTGLGFTRSLTSGRTEFGLEYLRSKSRSGLDFEVGSLLATRPLPRDETRLESVNLHASFKLKDRLSLRANYWYERFRSTDWAIDGIEPNQLANVILLGEDSPDYRVHVISLSLLYRF
jgi:MtrB/PioB family decaheme-associated outer membrane protein